MDDFAYFLLSSHKRLSKKDCLPTSDTGYRIEYGNGVWSPISMEIAFNLKSMTIRRLFIRTDLQREGIGRSIVAYLKRECVRIGLNKIELDTVLEESRGFWEKCGFTLSGNRGRWEVENE